MKRQGMTLKATAWWIRYNPLTQKPISLQPFVGWNWYSFYGPDPTAGVSYGTYVDESEGTIVLSEKKEVVYSPVSGKPMVYLCDTSVDEAKAKASGGPNTVQMKCGACGLESLVATSGDSGCKFCIGCGKPDTTAAVEESKPDPTKGKIMASESRIDALKARIAKRQAASAALSGKAYAKIVARRKAVAAEGESVSLDDLIEEVSNKEGKDAKGCELPAHAGDEGEAKPEAKPEGEAGDGEFMDLDLVLSAARQQVSISNARRVRIREKIKARAAARASEGATMDQQRRERIKARLAAKAAAETSDASREAIRAKIRAKVQAKMAVRASEDTPALDAAPPADIANQEPKPAQVTQIESEAPGLPGEIKEAAPAPEAGAPLVPAEPAAPGAEPDSLEPGMELEMKAMKFEPLASIDRLSRAGRDDIDMVLFDDQGDNPTWNVSVAGMPACKVALADQEFSDEIRAVFCSEDYAKDLLEHCTKAGFVPTMNRVKAKFWAHEFTKSKALDDLRGRAVAGLEGEKKQFLAAFKENFMNCVNVVSAGMNKNFYPEGNVLKDHLFSQLTTVGLPEHTAISVIEASFAEAAPSYFKSLFDKSTEYMNLSREARGEIAQAITRAPVLSQEGGAGDLQPVTLRDRVAQASLIPSLSSTGPAFQVRASASIDTNEFKTQLSRSWTPKLGG